MGRASCCDKENVKRGPWSPQEDAKLKAYIETFGTGNNWIALPQKIDSYCKLARVMENKKKELFIYQKEKKEVPSPNKGLLQSLELYRYILESSVYQNKPDPFKELSVVTTRHPRALMGMAPVQAK